MNVIHNLVFFFIIIFIIFGINNLKLSLEVCLFNVVPYSW